MMMITYKNVFATRKKIKNFFLSLIITNKHIFIVICHQRIQISYHK